METSDIVRPKISNVPKNNPCLNSVNTFASMIPYTYLVTFQTNQNDQYLSSSIQFAQVPNLASGCQFWILSTLEPTLQYGTSVSIESIFTFAGWQLAPIAGGPVNNNPSLQNGSYFWTLYGIDENNNLIDQGVVDFSSSLSFSIALQADENIVGPNNFYVISICSRNNAVNIFTSLYGSYFP